MSTPRIDFARINAIALANLETLLPQWLSGGRRNANEFVVGSLAGEPGQSLSINLNTGVWKDFAGEAGGSDPVSLYAAVHCLSQVEAARKLAQELGVDLGGNVSVPRPSPAQAKPADDWQPILPVPDATPKPDFKHYRHGQAVETWAYPDDEGRLLGYVCRFNTVGKDGEPDKEIYPLTYCQNTNGQRAWRFKGFPEPRPLYGLDRLAAAKPDTPVLWGEGEKTADAAQQLLPGAVCVTSSGGSKAVGKADFAPLAGRRVAIWPDADKPGYEAALAVVAKAKEAGVVEVSVIVPPEAVPKGWDLADALVAGWTPGQVKEHIKAHKLDVVAFEVLARDRYGIERKALKLAMAAPAAANLVVVDAGQLLSLHLPPREFILSPVIPRQGLVMLYAPRGIGKTFVALSLAYAVASGQRLFGWQAPKPCPVLYIDGEMPANTMQLRLAAIVAGYEQELPGPEWLRFITPDLQGIGTRMPNLATPEGQAALLPHLEGVGLVVVDNLATLARAGRENDAEGWLPVQEWILGLRQRGLSVCMVHHAGKGGQQRGTSSREDVLDTVISLKRPHDYRQEEGARFEVHLEKARGICGDDAKSFEARLETQGESLVWRCRDIEDVRLAQVKALLDEQMSVRDIAEETGIPKSTVQRMKKKLEAA